MKLTHKDYTKEATVPTVAARKWKLCGDGTFKIEIERSPIPGVEERFTAIHAGEETYGGGFWAIIYHPDRASFENSETHFRLTKEEFENVCSTHAFLLTLKNWKIINPRVDEADPEFYELDLDKKTITQVEAPDEE